MSPQRIVVVPARWFARFANQPEIQAAFGALLICVAIVTGYLAYRAWDEDRDTKKAAAAACLRTQELAPPLLAFFASFEGTPHAVPRDALDRYGATIPKVCPKP